MEGNWQVSGIKIEWKQAAHIRQINSSKYFWKLELSLLNLKLQLRKWANKQVYKFFVDKKLLWKCERQMTKYLSGKPSKEKRGRNLEARTVGFSVCFFFGFMPSVYNKNEKTLGNCRWPGGLQLIIPLFFHS